jgi:hypothetical protein
MTKDGLVFDQLSDTVLEIRDTISNQQYRIESSEPMDVEPTDYDDFPGPVTDSVVIDSKSLSIPEFYSTTVRDEDGNMETRLGLDGGSYKGDGTTFLELHTPVKSYIRIDGYFEYIYSLDNVNMEFSEETNITLGSRTWKCYPNNTITVTDSPVDLREAISHFGDAILTTSPERSFPTLRGHPPQLKIGESLDIPESLSKPDSGVTITVPPTTSALLTVAPLAYYLLATVETGQEFRLETSEGFIYRPKEATIPEAVKSILTRCFYLDCLVRTEGLYPVDLRERREFEETAEANLNYAELYEQSLPERIERYLQVDPGIISEVTTDWPVTAVVEPGETSIEALPYLTYELVNIRPEDPPQYTGNEARRHVLEAFSQGNQETRSTSLVFENKAEFIDVPETESRQTIWVGDGIPLNASKFLLEGYENNKIINDETAAIEDDGENSSSALNVTVVCNEDTMSRELSEIRTRLNPRDDFPMDLSIYSQLTTSEFEQILEKGTDYLHFVGHATPNGLECSNGMLDVAKVNQSNATTFFLNACQSFQQGTQLVKKGSSGGIVSYSDISDKYALTTSALIVQLLNEGFPIGVCLSIIQDTTPIGRQYAVVGSHGARLIQPDGGPPYISEVSKEESAYKITTTTYGAGLVQYAIGSGVNFALEAVEESSLVPSSVTVETDWSEVKEVLSLRESPVVYEGELQLVDEFIETIEQQRSSSGDPNT